MSSFLRPKPYSRSFDCKTNDTNFFVKNEIISIRNANVTKFGVCWFLDICRNPKYMTTSLKNIKYEYEYDESQKCKNNRTTINNYLVNLKFIFWILGTLAIWKICYRSLPFSNFWTFKGKILKYLKFFSVALPPYTHLLTQIGLITFLSHICRSSFFCCDCNW